MNGFEGANGVADADAVGADVAQGEEGGGSGAGASGGAGLRGERQPNKERITTPYLTKYERARVLGTRALQIRCVVYVDKEAMIMDIDWMGDCGAAV